jgi:hypothetical protein
VKHFLKLSAVVLSVSIIAGCNGGQSTAPTSPVTPAPVTPTTAPPDFSLTIGIEEAGIDAQSLIHEYPIQ